MAIPRYATLRALKIQKNSRNTKMHRCCKFGENLSSISQHIVLMGVNSDFSGTFYSTTTMCWGQKIKTVSVWPQNVMRSSLSNSASMP